jgi:hypothetical protein
MLVYTESVTPRLEYIVSELFHRRMGVNAQITTSVEAIESYKGPKINYSHHTLPGCLQLKPHAILFDSEIIHYAVSAKHHHLWDTLIWEQQGSIPFELFAASFYLITRYEEYLPHKMDDHGRFDPEQSLAVEYGFLETPLIDKWVLQLKNILQKTFGDFECNSPQYRFISTFDIDTAYLYKGLENLRQLRKTIKSATLLRFNQLAEQVQVLHGNLTDPYDTFEYLDSWNQNQECLYFVLSGGESEFDEAIPLNTPEMQTLLANLKTKYPIGLHPSYDSYDEPALISSEKQLLEQTIELPVTKSRQHFLRFRLPHTYQTLWEQGITEEYSMAYAKACGFRASTAHPFYFFNLETNNAVPLLIYPTTIMDVSLRYLMNLTISAAIQKIEQLVQEVKQVNGVLISIWHNSNLSETDDWLEWKAVFEALQKEARK